MEVLNKIKLWWLVIALLCVSIVSSKVFHADTKTCKSLVSMKDSLALCNIELETIHDSVAIAHSSAMGERDALAKQLDRIASQQIFIDRRTTNITRQYIIDTTTSKK